MEIYNKCPQIALKSSDYHNVNDTQLGNKTSLKNLNIHLDIDYI